jgi:hypothetical protein
MPNQPPEPSRSRGSGSGKCHAVRGAPPASLRVSLPGRSPRGQSRRPAAPVQHTCLHPGRGWSHAGGLGRLLRATARELSGLPGGDPRQGCCRDDAPHASTPHAAPPRPRAPPAPCRRRRLCCTGSFGFIQLAEKKKGATPFELRLDDELRGQVRGHVLGYDPGDCVVVGFDCGGASEFRVVPVVCLPREMVRALDITLAQRTAETETATAGYSHGDFTVGGYPSRTQAIYLLTNEAKPLAGRAVNGPMRDLLVRRVRYARAHNGTTKAVWRLFWTQAPEDRVAVPRSISAYRYDRAGHAHHGSLMSVTGFPSPRKAAQVESSAVLALRKRGHARGASSVADSLGIMEWDSVRAASRTLYLSLLALEHWVTY